MEYPMGLGEQRLARNALFNLLRFGWVALIGLLLLPYVVRKLGVDLYGIWALALALVSFAGLADLGMGATLIKFVAEHRGREELHRLNELLNTALVVYGVLALVVGIVFFAAFDYIAAALFGRVAAPYLAEARFVLGGSVLVFALTYTFTGYLSVPMGSQRYDVSAAIAAGLATLNAVGTVVVLEMGLGLRGLVLNMALVALVNIGLHLSAARWLLPQLVFNPLLFSRRVLREMLGFSTKMFASQVATVVHFQADKLILGYFLGSVAVTYYEAASALARQVRAAPETIIAPIMPAASELQALGQTGRLAELYRRAQRYNVLIGLPLVVLTALLADTIVHLWLGPGFGPAAFALRLLVLAYFANILTGPGFHLLNGMGQPQYGMYSSIFAVLTNLGFSLALVVPLGFGGVVMGTALSMVAALAYFLVLFHWQTGLPFSDTALEGGLRPVLAATIAATVAALLAARAPANPWAAVGLVGALFGIAYMGCLFLLRHFDGEDWRLLSGLLLGRGG